VIVGVGDGDWLAATTKIVIGDPGATVVPVAGLVW
jgi:hypothetical protein